MPNRRQFLQRSSALAAAFAAARLPLLHGAAPQEPAADKPVRKLRVLVLGGTGFIGPFLVKQAVARGHEVTTFNRGKSDPTAFADLPVRKLIGDRATGDLKALEGEEFDAVVDLWPSYPKYVRQALEVLADHCDQYLFISTISVYQPMNQPLADETAPVMTLAEHLDPEKVQLTGATYGALKVLCEQRAEASMPGQVTVLRPGLIVGPEDDTDRFTYWPVRVAAGGEVLAPGTPDDPVQVVDVRDLAAFTIHCLEQSKVGVMNVTGPQGGMPIGKMLEACKEASGSDAKFTWVHDEFLDEQKIAAWSDLPTWMSPRRDYGGIGAVSIQRALDAGFVQRPIVETARDTLQWYRDTQKGRALRAGMAREKETTALAAFAAAKQAGKGAEKAGGTRP